VIILKNYIIKALPVLLAVATAVPSVMASDSDFTYISESKTVKIEVQTEIANSLASVFVVPGSKVNADNTISSVSKEEIESGNYFYKPVKTDAEGKIIFDMDISDAKGGKYQAFVFVGDAVFSDDAFLHTNAKEIEEIIKKEINSAATDVEIAQIISQKSNTFGYEAEEIQQVCGELGKIIYASRPQAGYSSNKEFEEVYNRAMGIIEMKNAQVPSDYMETKGELFGINGALYKELAQSVKDDFANRIKNIDFLSADIDSIVKNSLYLAILNSNSDYTSMKKDALLFADYAGVNLEEKISGLDDYEKVLLFKDLFKADYVTIDAFILAVSEKAEQYEDASGNSGNSGSGGSGGGGGGGGGGGFTLPSKVTATPKPVVNTEKPVIDKEETYSDISSHWAKEIIAELSKADIISGYTDNTFKPDNNITRAEFAKILVCTAGKELVDKNVFSDVAPDDWCYKYIATANDMGIIEGNDGKFNPNGLISRHDAAVMIYRYVAKEYGELSGEADFKDIYEAPDYSVKSIKALAANGLVSGSDGEFNPLNNTTRAEAAAFIYKLISFMKEA